MSLTKLMSKEKTFEQRMSDQWLAAKGYLQSKHIGGASKKNWYSNIAYVQNIFALLTVWLNPNRLESKLGRLRHNILRHWVTCLWETNCLRVWMNTCIKRRFSANSTNWNSKKMQPLHEFLSNTCFLQSSIQSTSTLRNPKYSTLSSNTMTYGEGTKTSKKDSHLHPLQSSEVVEPMKIDPASLLVTEHKDILYKQKTKDKEFMLKWRISEMDEKNRDVKLKAKKAALLRASKRSKSNEERSVAAF